MSPTSFLAEFFGLYMLIIGSCFAFNRHSFIEAVSEISRHKGLVLLSGMIATMLGLFLVLSYNIWDQGLLPLLVTLFIWAILIKGVMLLLMPQRTIAWWTRMSKMRKYWYVYAIACMVLGFFFLYAGLA